MRSRTISAAALVAVGAAAGAAWIGTTPASHAAAGPTRTVTAAASPSPEARIIKHQAPADPAVPVPYHSGTPVYARTTPVLAVYARTTPVLADPARTAPGPAPTAPRPVQAPAVAHPAAAPASHAGQGPTVPADPTVTVWYPGGLHCGQTGQAEAAYAGSTVTIIPAGDCVNGIYKGGPNTATWWANLTPAQQAAAEAMCCTALRMPPPSEPFTCTDGTTIDLSTGATCPPGEVTSGAATDPTTTSTTVAAG